MSQAPPAELSSLIAHQRATQVANNPPWRELSFSAMRKVVALPFPYGPQPVAVSPDLMTALLKTLASTIVVNQAWYCEVNPDIARAIAAGLFKDAQHHYIEFGYFEDRLPRFINVDDDYYRAENQDVAAGIASGEIPSSQWHFEQHGFREGRSPSRGWTLLP
jgi:hypothetical protein